MTSQTVSLVVKAVYRSEIVFGKWNIAEHLSAKGPDGLKNKVKIEFTVTRCLLFVVNANSSPCLLEVRCE